MPLVSVIIPNYNHAPYLKQRIDSVLEQTFQDFEVIILDDCSPDNSREIIEQYRHHPKVVHIEYNTTNSGSPFKQWKKGIDLAKGKYIWIAESDDWAEKDFLEVLLLKFNEYDNLGIVYCQSNAVDENGKFLNNMEWWLDPIDSNKWKKSYFNKGIDECKEVLSYNCTITNVSACIFQKSKIESLDFDSNYKLCGDWYIYLQILKTFSIYYSSNCLNNFRTHNVNVRSNVSPLTNILEKLMILKYSLSVNLVFSISFNRAIKECDKILVRCLKTRKSLLNKEYPLYWSYLINRINILI